MNYYPIFQEGAYFENPEKEDPTVYVSEKTGRGPLETDWIVDTWAGMLISRMSSRVYYNHAFCPRRLQGQAAAHSQWKRHNVCLQAVQGRVQILGNADQN